MTERLFWGIWRNARQLFRSRKRTWIANCKVRITSFKFKLNKTEHCKLKSTQWKNKKNKLQSKIYSLICSISKTRTLHLLKTLKSIRPQMLKCQNESSNLSSSQRRQKHWQMSKTNKWSGFKIITRKKLSKSAACNKPNNSCIITTKTACQTTQASQST